MINTFRSHVKTTQASKGSFKENYAREHCTGISNYFKSRSYPKIKDTGWVMPTKTLLEVLPKAIAINQVSKGLGAARIKSHADPKIWNQVVRKLTKEKKNLCKRDKVKTVGKQNEVL